MSDVVEGWKEDGVGFIRLNKPRKLNARDASMRVQVVEYLNVYEKDGEVGAIVLTGAGDRAFCAGQDLEEAKTFDESASGDWIRSWELFYGVIRGLSKPLIIALNGLAAGSAFQVALLGDIRVGHPGVRMGQPEINAGIASVTGPWIMNLMLGMSRTVELTLTGRLMNAEECRQIGLLHHVVPAADVMQRAGQIARELAAKPPMAMRLDKQCFREMTEASFRSTIDLATRLHAVSYASGEPQKISESFFQDRRKRGRDDA